MLVSIVIPAYNAEATLGRCVEACLNQTHRETEVIVVDDGSGDDTARIAQAYPVHYLRQEHRGPASARNRGAGVAKGEVVALTDSDCIPESDWVERLLTGFEEGVVGVGGTYAIANSECLLARMIHEEVVARHARFGAEVDFLGSFNVAYRKDALDAVGGFDEDFTEASGEDNDLAYRLQDMGGRLRFVRDARVAHVYPTSVLAYLCAQRRHGFWRVRLYMKHPRRTRGDDYADLPELMAMGMPGVICLGLCMCLLILSSGYGAKLLPVPSTATLAFALAYLAIRMRLPLDMARNTGDARMLLFVPLSILRDIARMYGMERGACLFLTHGRVTK